MFIGYSDGIKGFKLIDSVIRTVLFVRNVIFREDIMWIRFRDREGVGSDYFDESEVSDYLSDVYFEIFRYSEFLQVNVSVSGLQFYFSLTAADFVDSGGGRDYLLSSVLILSEVQNQFLNSETVDLF